MPVPTHPPTIDPVRMLQALLGSKGLTIETVRANPAGIHLQLADAAQLALVKVMAAGANWLVTRENDRSISVEPRYTPSVTVLPGTRLYHVSDACKRDGIADNGLALGVGGNTTFARNYPARLHLCWRLGGALAFVNHQATSPGGAWFDPSGKPIPGTATRGPRELSELDIYVVEARVGMEFFQDSHFADAGIWTEEAFPKGEPQLLPRSEWEPTYRFLYPDTPLDLGALAHLMVAPGTPPPFTIPSTRSGSEDAP